MRDKCIQMHNLLMIIKDPLHDWIDIINEIL